MNLTELQVELRDIEKHISQLHLEIENMKPKTDEEKKTDYDAITKLAKQYPITGLGISDASDIQKKQFVSSLSYLLLTEEKNVYARLLYLCRLSFGCNLKLVAEDIYALGLEFKSKDIDKVCMDLENYKYSYLIEAFVIANLSEKSSTNILKIIADIAKVMGCDQEEIRVLAQIAKSKLMDDIDIVNHIPLPSRNRWSGKLNDYIPKSWIESQREKCIEICTEKYIKKSSSASSASLFLAMNMINESGGKTYDVKKPCVVKARVEAGSVVKKGTTILEYEEEVMHQKATSTSRVGGGALAMLELYSTINEERDSKTKKEIRKIAAPKDGIVFFVKKTKKSEVSDKEDEYLLAYVVSYYDEYSDFCKWLEKR